MLFVKHAICSTAGICGGVFGYVSAETDAWTLVGALIGMFSAALVADVLTQPMEVDEDGND
jgi:hypothetical protein